MKEADYSMAKNSGRKNRGIIGGILGSLAALGIGVVIGLYAIGKLIIISLTYMIYCLHFLHILSCYPNE